jgi:hypothetical protein
MRSHLSSDHVAADDRVRCSRTILDYSVNSIGYVVASGPQVVVRRDGRHAGDR